MSGKPSGGRSLLLPFALLFVLSGACALTYEVIWSRHLVHVFGVTAFAVSTVLVSFMGGMAAGAALLGPIADRSRRPLRLFALLEAGIGIYALLLPALLAGADAVYGVLIPQLPDDLILRSAIRFVFCVILLAVPTVLMGGTLPALGRGLLAREGAVGAGVGLLYFVNTLGAAIGCYAAGFELIPNLGLTGTTLLAAALNGVVALVAWGIDRKAPDAEMRLDGPAVPTSGTDEPLTQPAWWPLAVACGSGMAALAFEIVWFRVLMLSFGSTVYSFSAMLAVFLLGLALGSLFMGPIADRTRHPVRLLAAVQLVVALLTLAAGIAVNRMPHLFLLVIQQAGFDLAGMNRTKLLLSLFTLLPPALAFGATFPLAVSLYRSRQSRTGSRIGRVYAWNTLGAIAGSFGAGFILLPTIGAEWVMRLVVLLALALAFGTVLADRAPLRIAWAAPMGLGVLAVVSGLVFTPSWNRALLGAGVYFEPHKFIDAAGELRVDRVLADYKLINYTEGYNDTIISYSGPRGKFITVNGSSTATNLFEDMLAQRMMGHLPMLLHPGKVEKAAVIGLGAGVTTGALAIHEVDRVVSLELEAGVRAGAEYFSEENHDVLNNPVVDLRIDDGRNYLKLTAERFDVISSHPNFPSLSGSGVLFNREFLELAKERLAPGGVMCHYAPLWHMRPVDVRAIVGTFVDVFPHVRVFGAGNSVVLLGRAEEPFPPLDLDEIGRRMAREPVRSSLDVIGVRGPVELASWYLMDTEKARAYAGDAPRTSDYYPYIEFNAPHGLFSNTNGRNLEVLQGFRPSIDERIAQLGIEQDRAEAFHTFARGNDRTRDAEIALHRGEMQSAMGPLVEIADTGHRYAGFLVAGYSERQGLELYRRRSYDEAAASFRAALHYDDDRLESTIGLGVSYLRLGRLADAKQVLSEAVRRFPQSAAAHYNLGMVEDAAGQADAALDLYIRATELQPRLARPHALVGHAVLRRGDAETALRALQQAQRLGDGSEGVLTSIAEALTALGRNREALDRAREAAETYPDLMTPWLALARAAEASGRPDEAREARDRAAALGAGGG